MRPNQKGLEVLQGTLAEAEAALEAVKKQVADGARPTLDALAEVEVQRGMLAAEGVIVSGELSILSREIGEQEAVLDALRRRQATAEAARGALEERQRSNESRASSLTARLAEERGRAAPLLKVRQDAVDKLRRRVRLRTVHREARLAVLFPGKTNTP